MSKKYPPPATEELYLGEYPDFYQQEDVKKHFWHTFNEELDIQNKARNIVLLLIYSHYWRARECIEKCPKGFLKKVVEKKYFPGYQLAIDLYSVHWLWAMQYRFEKDVIEEIEKFWHYKPTESKYLPHGMTIYRSL